MAIQTINPANGERLKSFEPSSSTEIEAALDAAMRAFRGWSARPLEARCEILRAVAAALRNRTPELARLATTEMGKPIGEAEAEVEKCAWVCDYYADTAPQHLAHERLETNATRSYVRFDPLGTVLALMPWNFPFWQVFRFAAPTLAAGNVAILKHASNVPQCALAIEQVLRDAGVPDGVFRTLLMEGAAVEALIADSRIHAVTLTGSEATGARVAALAGASLKKIVLELGGSDPFIVLADADLEAAARVGARARNQNSGQSCIAAKRFIVEETVAPEFERLFTRAVEQLRVGDPLDRPTQVGPLARADLRDALHDQVTRARARGATLLAGGHALEGPGFYYAPTVLTNVAHDMSVSCEETFGPVAAVIRVRDAAHAIEVANASVYGLGASIWTSDIARAEELAARTEAGAVFINGLVASDPRVPFGGVKRSGYGRELSRYGLLEFVNIKAISVTG